MNSNPDSVSSPFGLNGEECPVDASGCSFAPRCSHLEYWTFFSSSTWLTPVMMVWIFRRIFTAFFGLLFGVEALPIHPEVLWIYTLAHIPLNHNTQQQHTTTTHNDDDDNDNNNNNTIWGGSVLTGEEPPPHSGEFKHALTQAGGPTQSQLSRPMSSGHHISPWSIDYGGYS